MNLISKINFKYYSWFDALLPLCIIKYFWYFVSSFVIV